MLLQMWAVSPVSASYRGSRFASNRGADLFVGAVMGFIATTPWIIAAWGWAQSWNAYVNLTFTLGGVVLWLTLWVAAKDAVSA